MSSYYSEEMLEETSREAEAALTRTVDWMARQTMKNMLHVDPAVAVAYGGDAGLLAKLKACANSSAVKLNLFTASNAVFNAAARSFS